MVSFLPEVHLAYAFHLYRTYRDYEHARIQLTIARRSMPHNDEAMQLEAFMDRRQGNFEKAIQELKEASTIDPRNPFPIKELAALLSVLRQFPAAEQAYARAIELAPDQPMLEVQKAHVNFWKAGDDGSLRAAVAALPGSMADDRNILSLRLSHRVERPRLAKSQRTD
jgi:tetratricopeptide (TPR) repeat protein